VNYLKKKVKQVVNKTHKSLKYTSNAWNTELFFYNIYLVSKRIVTEFTLSLYQRNTELKQNCIFVTVRFWRVNVVFIALTVSELLIYWQSPALSPETFVLFYAKL